MRAALRDWQVDRIMPPLLGIFRLPLEQMPPAGAKDPDFQGLGEGIPFAPIELPRDR